MIGGRLVALAIAFTVSFLAAYVVQLQIAISSNADLEHLLAMLFLFVVAVLSIVTLGAALLWGGTPRTLRAAALTLTALVMFAAMTALIISASGPRTEAAQARDLPLLVQMAVPSVIVIFIQWLLVRRRRRRELRTE